MAVAESCSDFKANENIKKLQQARRETGNQLSMARRCCNGAVRNPGVLVETFQ